MSWANRLWFAVHSVCTNHALVDGNKRLALGALIAFLGMNGHRLTWSNDEAFGFIMAIAAGELTDVAQISELIGAGIGSAGLSP